MKTTLFCVMLSAMFILLLSSCAAPKASTRAINPRFPAKKEAASVPITPAEKQGNDLAHVKNVVNARQGALQNIYRKQSAIKAMQGSLAVKLFITEMGVVQNAELSIDEGMLSPEFVEAVRQEILSWRFMIRDKIIYSFKVQFNKM